MIPVMLAAFALLPGERLPAQAKSSVRSSNAAQSGQAKSTGKAAPTDKSKPTGKAAQSGKSKSGGKQTGKAKAGKPTVGKPKAPQKPEKPFSKPFRYRLPIKDPKWDKDFIKLLGDIDRLANKWRQAGDRGFDQRGVPTTALRGFAELRDDIVKRLAKKGGHLRVVMTDDKSSMRRRAAFFGLMLVPERQAAVHLLRYIPHEPRVGVRRQAALQSFNFFEAHCKTTKEGKGPQGGYSYVIDLGPWLDLTRAKTVDDVIIGLEALRRFAVARPGMSNEILYTARKWMGSLLASKHAKIRKGTHAWLAAAAPKHKIAQEPEQAMQDFTTLIRTLYPAIRLHGGFCSIHPGPMRDELIKVGRKLLKEGGLGKAASRAHKTKRGTFHKLGILIQRLPAPLDRLGLRAGDLLTTLNGMPLDSQKTLLATLEKCIATNVSTYTLEWLTQKGELRVQRYAIAANDD